MWDLMNIAPTPSEEDCECLGPNYRPDVAKKECRIFRQQLIRQFGEPPFGARLVITNNSHDLGVYHEVEVKFDDTDKAACDYAFKLEDECPEFWDEQARIDLGADLKIKVID